MNFKRLKHLFFAAACLLISKGMPAQTLPQLSPDTSIRQGKLGCGASYYIVSNTTEKGYAHIAVVQMDSVTAEKRTQLHPDFPSRMGILPGPEGFLSQHEGHACYRFPHIPAYRPQVLDSTLLYTFAQMALCQEPQAIIVSGDVDPAQLKQKMDIFSMMVPKLRKASARSSYAWTGSIPPTVRFQEGGNASACVTYASARIPQEQMNTAQALVTDMFAREFGTLLRHRLEKNLKEEGVPWREIGFSRTSSDSTAGDEQYSVRVVTAPEQLLPATEVLARTLGEWERLGVSESEFSDAKQVLEPGILRQAQTPLSNQEELNRCIAHYLYGASLVPFSEEARLFTRKNLSEATETQLFNGFSSALLQQLSNLTLTFTAAPDSLDGDQALFRYNLAWLYGWATPEEKDYSWHRADTLGLEPAQTRIRITNEKAEPVSGGVLWTFSNGMRVAYKQLPGSGESFHYALQLNGGLSRIPNLKEGEGGYIPEVLPLFNTGGMQAPAFRDMLAGNGISMRASTDLNNLYILGSAPAEKLSLTLKALVALARKRSLNGPETKAFLQNGKLQEPSLPERLDALMTPGYVYSSAKQPDALSLETLNKASRYFEERFSQANDGILLLSGSMDPAAVKRILLRYMGAFRTVKNASAPRRQVPFRTLSGVSTHADEGAQRGLYVLLDADCPLTALNFPASFMAAEAVRSALAAHWAGTGLTVTAEPAFLAYPQERLRLLIQCRPTGEARPEGALTAVRAALKDAAAHPVEAQDLKAWKQLVTNNMQRELSTQAGVISTLLARYAAGKDLSSRYQENIQDITAERVEDMLKALSQGGRIEYLVL